MVNCVFVGVNLLRDDPAGGRTTAPGYNCLEGSDAAAGTAWLGAGYGSRSCLSSIIMQNRPDGFGMWNLFFNTQEILMVIFIGVVIDNI